MTECTEENNAHAQEFTVKNLQSFTIYAKNFDISENILTADTNLTFDFFRNLRVHGALDSNVSDAPASNKQTCWAGCFG